MDWGPLALALVAGLMVATVTTPVGVSGAVFLLPVQLDVLHVPNPAVTPTNLLYNVVSGPGALLRYWFQGQRPGDLTRSMLLGTLPGVIAGACIRVYLVPNASTFRLVAAAVLLPIGVWLIWRSRRAPAESRTEDVRPAMIAALGLAVGVLGGVYGIGGGSILAPILVARGLPVSKVAPAALASTFLTSIVGAMAFGVLALQERGEIAPDWDVGIALGFGGLIGGYLGARWHHRLPDAVLTLMLGTTATALSAAYLYQALG